LEKAATAASPRQAELKALLVDERRQLDTRVKPALKAASLRSGLEALAAQKWDQAARLVSSARRLDAKAPQPDLLECVLLASRYVLTDPSRRDPVMIQNARARLRDWQTKTGTGV